LIAQTLKAPALNTHGVLILAFFPNGINRLAALGYSPDSQDIQVLRQSAVKLPGLLSFSLFVVTCVDATFTGVINVLFGLLIVFASFTVFLLFFIFQRHLTIISSVWFHLIAKDPLCCRSLRRRSCLILPLVFHLLAGHGHSRHPRLNCLCTLLLPDRCKRATQVTQGQFLVNNLCSLSSVAHCFK